MLLIETRLLPSEIHGIGVFPEYAVNKGTPVWRFDPIIDRIIRKDEIEAADYLPEHVIDHLQRHGYTRGPNLILALDHKMYVNHARPANLRWNPVAQVMYADCHIRRHHELTMDYAQYSSSAYAQSL